MIIIKTKRFPPKGFKALTFWPFIFYKEQLTTVDLNHEKIHARQQTELLLVGFYLAYITEWIFKGYDSISFEEEAYANEADSNYLKTRKAYAMWRKTPAK